MFCVESSKLRRKRSANKVVGTLLRILISSVVFLDESGSTKNIQLENAIVFLKFNSKSLFKEYKEVKFEIVYEFKCVSKTVCKTK